MKEVINGYCQLDLTDVFEGLGFDEVNAESLNEVISEKKIDLYGRLKSCLDVRKPVIVLYLNDKYSFEILHTGILSIGIDKAIQISLFRLGNGTIESLTIDTSPENSVTNCEYHSYTAS